MSRQKRELFDALIDEVRRSQAATDRYDQAVADALGLGRTDMRCIDVLQREGGRLTAGQLAEATGLTSGAMTAAIDRLEQLGYARRVRDPDDRRRVLVELTETVGADLGQFYAEHAALAEQLYDRHTAAELEMLLTFVRGGRQFNEEKAAALERETRARRAG
jgi:DNA-binding MarR family transcriptional regulator